MADDFTPIQQDDFSPISSERDFIPSKQPKLSLIRLATTAPKFDLTTPISKLITGKSIGERTDLLEKRSIELAKQATAKVIAGGRPPTTTELFLKALPHATGQALINFLDLSPLDVGIMGITAGAMKIPFKGTTIGQIAKTVPVGRGFMGKVTELGRYQTWLKTTTPLSSRGITQVVEPSLGITPAIPEVSTGKAISKLNLTKYEPEIQEGIKKILNSNPDLLARKKISHIELDAMAQQLKSTPIIKKILAKPEGELAAEILKLRQGEDAIIRSTLQGEFDDLIGGIRNIISTKQTQAVARTGTEIGRALEQFKIPIESQSQIAELINQKILQFRKDPTIKGDDLKRVISGLVDFRKTILSRDFNPSWFDKGYEYWLNNILSGPWTHTVNITSNTLFGGTKPIEKGIYSTVDTFLSLFTGKREHYFSEIPAQFQGLKMAVSGKPLPTGVAFGTKLETTRVGTIKGLKGKTIRLPTKALVIEDNVQKRMIGFMELVGRAEATAKQEGLKGVALIARKNQLLANPTGKLTSEVQAEQLYRTFQDSTGLGEYLKMFPQKGFRWIMPFRNTLSSIIIKAFERTPAGLIKVGYKGAKQLTGIPYPQKEVAIDLGNAAMGIGLFASVGYALKKTTITGAAPQEKAKRDVFFAQGKQPYSFGYRGKYIPFSRIEPYGTAAMQMIDVIQGYVESDKEISVSKLTDAVGKLSYSLANKTFLSGMTYLVGALSDPERYAEQMLGRIAGGFVPFSGLARNIQQMTDLTVRSPEGIPERVASQVPGFAKTVPERISSFGEIIRRKPVGITRFIPFPITQVETNRVADELSRLDIAIGYPSKKITLPTKQEVKLNRQEYSQLLMRKGGATVKTLENVISTPYYQRLPKIFQTQMVEHIISKIGSIAKTELAIKKIKPKFPNDDFTPIDDFTPVANK